MTKMNKTNKETLAVIALLGLAALVIFYPVMPNGNGPSLPTPTP